MNSIPVVDFADFAIDVDRDEASDSKVTKLASKIHEAFSNIGFVYLKNHGIPETVISNVFSNSDNFFNLPLEVKQKYKRGKLTANHGWLKLGGEQFGDRPADYKECYDVNPLQAKSWPEEEVPCFQSTTTDFYEDCRKLAARVLELIAIGLKLHNKNYFVERHNSERFTYTALRYLHYPPLPNLNGKPLPPQDEFPSGQLRCGEHTDYGSLTVLFQDEAGGLEVFDRDHGYVPAPYIPGTCIINLGDLMQRWTSDQLVSTKHRVLPPKNNGNKRSARRSIVCFFHPDADCLVECIDGSNKYPPITAKDWIEKRFKSTLT